MAAIPSSIETEKGGPERYPDLGRPFHAEGWLGGFRGLRQPLTGKEAVVQFMDTWPRRVTIETDRS